MFKGTMTRLADAAHALQHLLVKFGSDADHIAVAGVADMPIGTCDDTPGEAEASAAVRLLGSFDGSITMVASEVIGAGVRVFQAAGGKVSLLPEAAGDYWCVGTSLTAAAADEDELEVDACVPYPVTVAA